MKNKQAEKGLEVICDGEYDFSELGAAVFAELGQSFPLAADVSIVDEENIKDLNARFRNKDEVTDVLSFPALDGVFGKVIDDKEYPFDFDCDTGRIYIGSIALCIERARLQADEYGHSTLREVFYLVCHGLLHLFGYDHMTDSDKAVMREREEAVMSRLGLTRGVE